jgi:hypothetical protein
LANTAGAAEVKAGVPYGSMLGRSEGVNCCSGAREVPDVVLRENRGDAVLALVVYAKVRVAR